MNMKNTNLRSLLPACALGIGLATSLVAAACKSAEVTTPAGGIKIVGDDDKTVTAKGLEDALKQSLDAKTAAEQRHDAPAAADWAKIIEKLTKAKKGTVTQQQLIDEAEATGELTITELDDGNTVYSWTAGGVGSP